MAGGTTKRELMEDARRLDIPGRSTMTKAELEAAVRRAQPGETILRALHNPGVHIAVTEFLRHVARYLR